MNRNTVYFPSLLLVVFLQACTDTDTVPSDEVRTESIVADYRIETFNHKTAHIYAQLHRESHDYEFVILENHDRLITTTETNSIILTLENELYKPEYVGEIEIEENSPVTFSFYRNYYPDREQRWYPSDLTEPEVDESLVEAPRSWVEMPPAFEIVTPLENTEYYQDDDIVSLSWHPVVSGSLMRILAHPILCESDYILPETSLIIGEDSGVANIEVAELLNPLITTNSIPCDIELVLYREQHGFLDENFSGGSIISAYAQRVRLRYLPVTVNTQ